MITKNMSKYALVAVFSGLFVQVSHADELQINKIDATAAASVPTAYRQPDQLPMSQSASGINDIKIAWLAKPTTRYRHGVLGDKLEATQLRVVTNDGETLSIELEQQRVFEDLQPRVVDLDGDKKDEIIVVESDENSGASLSVFGVKDGLLQRISASEFLGRPYRWLNPTGVGDFDGDGALDIALVATPHIGGVLRLYHYQVGTLVLFAERTGISTHSIGSTELGLAAVVKGKPDKLIVPNQDHNSLLLIQWDNEKWMELSRVELPAKITTSLVVETENSWTFSMANGEALRLTMQP